MADDDGGSNFDTRFGYWDAPAGSGQAFGTTATDQGNQPLVNWYNSLKPDDLANFAQNPDAQAAQWAKDGVLPPPMEHVHAANAQAGTPSDPSRFDNTSNLPFSPPPGATRSLTPQQEAQRGIQEQKSRALGYTDPGGGFGQSPESEQDLPAKPKSGRELIRTPAEPKTTDRPPGYTPPATPIVVKPQPPVAPQPQPQAQPPAQTKPPGSDLDQGDTEADTATTDKPGDKTPSERKKVMDALGTIGKAMQGVKAPEPLKPPAGFAPSPRAPLAAGAPQLASILGLTGGGQVPGSVAPLLRLMGR